MPYEIGEHGQTILNKELGELEIFPFVKGFEFYLYDEIDREGYFFSADFSEEFPDLDTLIKFLAAKNIDQIVEKFKLITAGADDNGPGDNPGQGGSEWNTIRKNFGQPS